MKIMTATAILGLALAGLGIFAVGTPGTGRIASSQPAAATLAPQAAATAVETVTLEVGNMSCASCPYIVRRALQSTPGVIEARVSFRDRLAVVIFDPARATVADLVEATSAIGYPSRPVVN